MKVHIDLFDRVRVYLGKTATMVVEESVVLEIKNAFTHDNPNYEKRSNEEPYIATHRTEHGDDGSMWLSLPRGGFKRVREILAANHLSWNVQDRRSLGDPAFHGLTHHLSRPLWDYQEEARDLVIKGQNCLLRAPTGSGKTTNGFAIIAAIGLPALVVVYDGGLFRQWVRRCTEELGIPPKDVGIVKGPPKKWKFGAITVASSSTLAQHEDFYAIHGWRFGTVLADEVQGFAAKTMFQSVDPCPAKYRIGISADETRKDKLECLVYDLFGSVACDIPLKRVIASGNVLDVVIRVVPTEFRADWYRERFSGGGSYKQDDSFNKLLDEIAADEARNALAIDLVKTEAKKGLQVIVWSARVEHCRALDNLLAHHGVLSGLMLGDASNATEFERTRTGLVDGTLNAGVGTIQAIGQAVDIPLAARGVLTTPLAANKQRFGQVRGRICRTAKAKGKVDAELYYLWDHKVYGLSHLENLVKWHGNAVVVRDGLTWIPARTFMAAYKREVKRSTTDIFDELME